MDSSALWIPRRFWIDGWLKLLVEKCRFFIFEELKWPYFDTKMTPNLNIWRCHRVNEAFDLCIRGCWGPNVEMFPSKFNPFLCYNPWVPIQWFIIVTFRLFKWQRFDWVGTIWSSCEIGSHWPNIYLASFLLYSHLLVSLYSNIYRLFSTSV